MNLRKAPIAVASLVVAPIALAACDRAAAQHQPVDVEPVVILEPEVPEAPVPVESGRRQVEWPGGGATVTYGAER